MKITGYWCGCFKLERQFLGLILITLIYSSPFFGVAHQYASEIME